MAIFPISPPDPPLPPLRTAAHAPVNFDSPPHTAKRNKPDKVTPLVLQYLRADRSDLEATNRAFSDLVALCYSACRGLYLWNGSGGRYEPQWPEYLVAGAQARRENTRHHQRREWIQEWILARLTPHYDETEEQIEAAAAQGRFRWLDRECRQGLVKEIRWRYPKKDQSGVFPRACVSLDTTVNEDAEPLSELLAARPVTGDPEAVVADNRIAFDRLGIRAALEEIIRGCKDGLRKSQIVHSLAVRLGIGERAARARIQRCRETINANQGIPAVRELFHVCNELTELATEELPDETRDQKFRRKLLSEAAKDRWNGLKPEDSKKLKAEEAATESGDFVLSFSGSGRAKAIRIRPQRNLARRATQVDALDNDYETFYADGIELDRYGEEIKDSGDAEVEIGDE
jgi:hypothetical protein